MRNGKTWYWKEDLAMDVIANTLVGLLTIIFVYPVIYTLSLSLSSSEFVERHLVWLLPRGFTLSSYSLILKHEYLLTSFINSILYMTLYTTYALILTIFGAYALSHKQLRGRNFFSFLIFFAMLFNGGLIPTYLLIKSFGMIDTTWAMFIPLAVSPFNLIVMRSVLQQNPPSLEESATLDGAGYFRILFSIIIPISKPVIATIALFYAVSKWNDFFTALIYLNTKSKFPLQLIARELLVTFSDQSFNRNANEIVGAHLNFTPLSFRAAVIIFTILPLMVIYPFIQKYFVKGILIGSVKG